MTCTCTPGEPRSPPGETWRDLVDVEGMAPEDAAVVVAAAEEALRRGIEPGIRRARFIDGFVAGYTAAQNGGGDYDAKTDGVTDALLQQARELVDNDSEPDCRGAAGHGARGDPAMPRRSARVRAAARPKRTT